MRAGMKQNREREITKPCPVLDFQGHPNPGFSRKSIMQYDRRAIHAWPWRIKEWDFYQISNERLCLQFTIGHVGYAGQVCLNLFDFTTGERHVSRSRILPLVFDSLHMPADAEQPNRLVYHKDGISMCLETRFCSERKYTAEENASGHAKITQERILRCRWNGVEAAIRLRRKNPDSLVVNIPFEESPHAFYYNQKINCMTAEGAVRLNGKEWKFSPSDSFAVLDWGRGVWPFHNEWYWSNGTGIVNGEIFGFNLGCGFGNADIAGENMLFYQGKSHKIGKVDFVLGKDHSEPWHLRDREGRVDLTLTPSYDNLTVTKLLWVDNCCHQMFGKFNGHVILDDGSVLEIRDLTAFAEHAVNNW